MDKVIAKALSVMVAVVVVSTMASAEEMGTEQIATIGAGVDAGILWHSNPYYRPDGEASQGMIYTLDPSIRVAMPVNEMLYIGVDGRLSLTQVSFTESSPDGDKAVVHPFVRGLARYNLSPYTSFSLLDEFQTANVDDIGDNPRFYLNKVQVEGAHVFGGRVKVRSWYRNVRVDQSDEAQFFDSQDNAVGLGAAVVVGRSADGRDIQVGIDGDYGEKGFDEGSFVERRGDGTVVPSANTENPKTHTYWSVGAKVTWPVMSLLTVNARAGWRERDYDVVGNMQAKSESGTPYAGVNATLTPSPGGPLSFTASASRETTDTVIYNIPTYDTAVFEATDAQLNNLEITYRELDVTRAGLVMDYRVNSKLTVALSGVYQVMEADAEEDLAWVGGNVDPHGLGQGVGRSTSQSQWMFGGSLCYRVMETLSVDAGYQHGFATDDDASKGVNQDEDLYEYDSLGLIARLSFF